MSRPLSPNCCISPASGFHLLAVLLALAFHVSALEGATLSGRVDIEGTGNYAEGAVVELLPDAGKQLTTRTGGYRFSGLDAGDYTLRVSYPGAVPQSASISLASDEIREFDFSLSSEIFELEDFVVSAELEGNAASLVAQQNAPNVTNDVALDAFGSIADGNIGDFIRRLPGVSSAELINGDIGGFDVRGIPQALNTVSIDGAEAASANAAGTFGDRSFPIDIIPAELIESLTLTKSLTPDMPANSIGGNVNLVSKSAFKVKSRRINYRVGYNINTYRSDTPWGPTAAFTYLDHFGEDRSWGIAVSGSFSRTVNTQDRTSNTLYYAGGNTNVDEPIVKARLRLIDGEFTRDRTGAGIKLEKRLGDRLTLLVDLKYTHFDYELERNDYRISGVNRVVDYSVNNREAIFNGASALDSNRARASLAPGYSETYQEMLDATLQNYISSSTKRTELWSFRTAAHLDLDGGWLKFDANHSRSTSDYLLRNFYIQHPRGKGIIIDEEAGSIDLPAITELYNARIGTIFAGSDIDAYTSNGYSLSPDEVVDEKTTARLDWQKQVNGLWPVLYVQSGAAIQRKDYFTEKNLYRWNFTGGALSQFVSQQPSVSLFNYYPSFDALDGSRVDGSFSSEPGLWQPNAANVDIPPSLLVEDIFSAYAMSGLTFNKAASVLIGVRIEHTALEGTGSMKFRNEPEYQTIHRKSSFTDYFPGVHFRYSPRDDLVLRASWSQSMGRPSIRRQVPATTIIFGPNPDDPDSSSAGSVIENNINLKPMYSDNFDLTVEWYLPYSGVLSVGAFAKEISGYISRVRSEIGEGPDNGWGGEYENFTYITDRNLSDARVRGLEFNYSQNLVFLPGQLSGLSVNANLTLQQASGTFDDGLTDLPQFKDLLGNLGVSYRFWRMRFRVNYNYASSFLSEYNDQYFYLSRYVEESHTVDVNLHLKLTPRHSFFVDVANIFNDHPNTYMANDPKYVIVHERNGVRLSFGLFGRF